MEPTHTQMSNELLIAELKLEVYRHFPPRSIKLYEELVRRFKELNEYLDVEETSEAPF